MTCRGMTGAENCEGKESDRSQAQHADRCVHETNNNFETDVPHTSIPLLFPPGNLPGETFQFVAIDDFVLHHADQKLLDRPATETIDDLPDRARGYVVRPLRAFVNERSAFGAMRDVALFLEPPQNGADRSILQRVFRRQSFA